VRLLRREPPLGVIHLYAILFNLLIVIEKYIFKEF